MKQPGAVRQPGSSRWQRAPSNRCTRQTTHEHSRMEGRHSAIAQVYTGQLAVLAHLQAWPGGLRLVVAHGGGD